MRNRAYKSRDFIPCATAFQLSIGGGSAPPRPLNGFDVTAARPPSAKKEEV